MLKADGIAVFCEPGPNHSLHPMSQAEMRMFDVIENDIVIEKIWETAHEIGFTDLKISLFSIKPVLCSIQEFSTLAEFDSSHNLLERMYRENFKPVFDGLRLFVLVKDAPEKTSKLKDGLRCDISFDIEESDTSYAIRGHVTNVGDATWLPSGLDPGCVNIGLIRRAADGTWDQNFRRVMLLSDKAPPGAVCAFEFSLLKAEVPPESEFYIDLVAEFIAWFEMVGGKRERII